MRLSDKTVARYYGTREKYIEHLEQSVIREIADNAIRVARGDDGVTDQSVKDIKKHLEENR